MHCSVVKAAPAAAMRQYRRKTSMQQCTGRMQHCTARMQHCNKTNIFSFDHCPVVRRFSLLQSSWRYGWYIDVHLLFQGFRIKSGRRGKVREVERSKSSSEPFSSHGLVCTYAQLKVWPFGDTLIHSKHVVIINGGNGAMILEHIWGGKCSHTTINTPHTLSQTCN